MDLTDFEKQIILALAERDMNIAAAAVKLYMHRNTVIYHLDKIQRKTGRNPRKFYDLVELVKTSRI